MQVPELLRGRLHNLRSSYLKRAVRICRQSGSMRLAMCG